MQTSSGNFRASALVLTTLLVFGPAPLAPSMVSIQEPAPQLPPPDPPRHLEGTEAGEVLEGGTGNDTVEGREGDDWLFGETGDDVLRGGDGSDTLDGGPGTDVLVGGPGDDLLNDARPDSDEVDENDLLLGAKATTP